MAVDKSKLHSIDVNKEKVFIYFFEIYQDKNATNASEIPLHI
jgi:hypothetical protein